MKKVITYGTYDLLHEGHIKLLERAKSLGDFLIVGVTADGFDLARGKINVQQSLMDRIEAVMATGLADQIIIEEYEGQKIDDIRKYNVDIFTVGSDWNGKFDYLKEYCQVVYLDRTQGVSSSELRSHKNKIRIGLVGETRLINKFYRESRFVNGVVISGLFALDFSAIDPNLKSKAVGSLDELIKISDALYIASLPESHSSQVASALSKGLHVLCEAPISFLVEEYQELRKLAKTNNLILMDGIKTAYSLAFSRLLLLVKGGVIGKVVAVDTTCTSLLEKEEFTPFTWSSINWWGPTALLPITGIFGCEYSNIQLVSHRRSNEEHFDLFTYGSIVYPDGVATFKVGQGVKSEGEMIISGTKGYIYVPAPWWKTDYFEVRYENPSDNKRYFYQLDGEGIRHEIRSFVQMINGRDDVCQISHQRTEAMIRIIGKLNRGEDIKI